MRPRGAPADVGISVDSTAANLGNIIRMVLAGLILPFLPPLPIQVLLINLIYDCAPMACR